MNNEWLSRFIFIVFRYVCMHTYRDQRHWLFWSCQEGSSEQYSTGAWNQTLVLCKTSKCSYPLRSPSLDRQTHNGKIKKKKKKDEEFMKNRMEGSTHTMLTDPLSHRQKVRRPCSSSVSVEGGWGVGWWLEEDRHTFTLTVQLYRQEYGY